MYKGYLSLFKQLAFKGGLLLKIKNRSYSLVIMYRNRQNNI